MTHGTIGWPWCLKPSVITIVFRSNHILTPALMHFEISNGLDLNFVILDSEEVMFTFLWTSQKSTRLRKAENMLKSHSAKMMFEMHPGFRKRYPRSGFWSGYEHHESTGLIDLDKSIAYCCSQQQRHGVIVIDDRQQRLPGFAAEWGYGKTEAPSGAKSLPRKRGGTGDYKGATLISFQCKYEDSKKDKKYMLNLTLSDSIFWTL